MENRYRVELLSKDGFNRVMGVLTETNNHGRACAIAMDFIRYNRDCYIRIVDNYASGGLFNEWYFPFPLREKNTRFNKAWKRGEYARAQWYSSDSMYRQSYNEYHSQFTVDEMRRFIKDDILCDTRIGEKARKQLLDNFFPDWYYPDWYFTDEEDGEC